MVKQFCTTAPSSPSQKRLDRLEVRLTGKFFVVAGLLTDTRPSTASLHFAAPQDIPQHQPFRCSEDLRSGGASRPRRPDAAALVVSGHFDRQIWPSGKRDSAEGFSSLSSLSKRASRQLQS